MEPFAWTAFLNELDRRILANPEECWVEDEVHVRGTLGFPGADEGAIGAAEARLGTRFPPSYRAFLQASNGWEAMGTASPGKLWSTEKVEWLSVRNHEFIDEIAEFECGPETHLAQQGKDCIWFHGPYAQRALEISDWGDACILFLCPDVTTPEGEWECWEYASWNPGADRYPSFQDWFVKQLEREW